MAPGRDARCQIVSLIATSNTPSSIKRDATSRRFEAESRLRRGTRTLRKISADTQACCQRAMAHLRYVVSECDAMIDVHPAECLRRRPAKIAISLTPAVSARVEAGEVRNARYSGCPSAWRLREYLGGVRHLGDPARADERGDLDDGRLAALR